MVTNRKVYKLFFDEFSMDVITTEMIDQSAEEAFVYSPREELALVESAVTLILRLNFANIYPGRALGEVEGYSDWSPFRETVKNIPSTVLGVAEAATIAGAKGWAADPAFDDPSYRATIQPFIDAKTVRHEKVRKAAASLAVMDSFARRPHKTYCEEYSFMPLHSLSRNSDNAYIFGVIEQSPHYQIKSVDSVAIVRNNGRYFEFNPLDELYCFYPEASHVPKKTRKNIAEILS